MPAAESKTMYVVVRHLNHCPDLEEQPAPLGALEEEHTHMHAIKVTEVPEQPPISVQEEGFGPRGPPSSTVVSAAPSGTDVMEPVPATGAEGLVSAEMPATETKTRYMVVRPLNHCPDLEEPPAPLSTSQEEHAQACATKVTEVPEQPPVSEPASAPEEHPEPPQEPAPAPTFGPAAPSWPEVMEPVVAAGAEGLA
ncbi:unnamed protein product [Nyctereutes procyonoides]|uniref:(raccoon dog) hypothetical protein n=1 Tax=Nyctereutes procyonoides TaxID=34880 RepID=A0A811YZI9_NYCPR|nr:unnamed protein product [Nyctereutes procyonoides]